MTARLVTEFIGTFVLVTTIGLTALQDAPSAPFAPLAIGTALMAVVYMGGHISGAHYNPAVTLAVWMRGKIEAGMVLPYMLTQVASAALAALFVQTLMGATFVPVPGPSATMLDALLAELIFTFVLALVVLNVATDEATAGNSYYGLAIGFTVLAGAYAVGAISGGAFNPAVGLGPGLVHGLGGGPVGHVWLYLVGPLMGGAAAALVYRVQRPRAQPAAA